MKTARKVSLILKIAGWVLIALALALTIYNLANDSEAWKSMKNATTAAEESVGSRIAFDHQYFKALINAAGTKDVSIEGDNADKTLKAQYRADEVRPYFEPWENRIKNGLDRQNAALYEAFITEKNESFDAEAYLEYYESLEGSQDARALKDAFEYLNGAIQPAAAGKGGKAIGKLQAASIEPDFESFYAGFCAEYGEEAGTYLEFVESVAALVKEDTDSGAKITDAKAYLRNMDAVRYFEALQVVLATERAEDEDIRDEFCEYLEGYIAGDKDKLREYFEHMYSELKTRYPKQADTEKNIFVNELYKALNDESFDGSFATLAKLAQSAQSEYEKINASGAMDAFAKSVVVVSDRSNSVSLAPALWFLAAHYVLMALIGVMLLVAALLIKRITTRNTINRLKSAGIKEDDDVLLRVEHLKQYFKSGDYINKAVDDVSFYIKKGEVFGLVGESGCGKTTTGRTIINLYDPTEGDVYFRGLRISSTLNGLSVLKKSLQNEFEAKKNAKKTELNEKIAAEPSKKEELESKYSAWLKEEKLKLDKRISDAETRALESYIEKSKCVDNYRAMRKKEITEKYEKDIQGLSGEALKQRTEAYKRELKVASKDNVMTKMQMIFQDPIASINPRMTVREIIAEGLKIRGIKDEKYIDEKVYEVLELVGLVREHASRYPHEFSGGQRQRIGIARAIVLEPELIIADEPISALDVSIQAQVINLLNELRDKMGLTIMFIAHNLSVVKYFSDRIGVMYYGHLVELTTSEELFKHPLHPYTKSLLSAIPYPDPYHEKYRKRIEYDPNRTHDYSVDKPSLREIVPGHFIRCNDSEFEAYKKELGIK